MKPVIKWALVGLAVIAFGAVLGRAVLKRQANAQAAAQSASSAQAEAALDITASDLVTASRQELIRTLELSGTVRATNSAFVKARVAAELKSVNVREGDTVRAGQVLAQLDTTEFDWRLRQAEQQAQAAKAQLDMAQRALANNKALVAQGFISPTALDTAVSTEAGAQANLQAALAAVELARKAKADATITAPLGGLVSQRLAQPGERVGVDARLLEIVDLSRLELEAAVPAADAPALRVGQQARVHMEGSNRSVMAKVARINPSAQAGSRAVPAYLELQGDPALRHGVFARGVVELDKRSALVIPASAVRQDQPAPYALKLDGNRTVRKLLKLGGTGQLNNAGGTNDMVEVLEGLAEGDRVLAGHLGMVRAGTLLRLVK